LFVLGNLKIDILNSYGCAARAVVRVGVASKELKRGGADHSGVLRPHAGSLSRIQWDTKTWGDDYAIDMGKNEPEKDRFNQALSNQLNSLSQRRRQCHVTVVGNIENLGNNKVDRVSNTS
jgi:hypothetical protein